MIVIDTHVWIWLMNESDTIPKPVLMTIQKAETLAVSVIRCWEVTMRVAKKRLGLIMDVEERIDLALTFSKVRFLPIDPKIAVLSPSI